MNEGLESIADALLYALQVFDSTRGGLFYRDGGGWGPRFGSLAAIQFPDSGMVSVQPTHVVPCDIEINRSSLPASPFCLSLAALGALLCCLTAPPCCSPQR